MLFKCNETIQIESKKQIQKKRKPEFGKEKKYNLNVKRNAFWMGP